MEERDDTIDELYEELWNLIDEMGSLHNRALEIGEKMKTVVSSKFFKTNYYIGSKPEVQDE